MNRHIFLCVILFLYFQVSFCNSGVVLLNGLVSKKLFTFKNKEDKKTFDEQLTDGKINIAQLSFDGVTLEDMDLSGMYLRGIDFSGCTFIRVNLQRADLTETRWDRAQIDNIQWLKDAILYYSPQNYRQQRWNWFKFDHLKGLQRVVHLDQAFRIKSLDNYSLVKLYSELMSQARIKKFDPFDSEVKVLLEKTACLNKVIGSLKMNLRYRKLQDLDLTDMALTRANLDGADLQGAWLSKNVRVPNYEKWDKRNLFQAWAYGDQEHQDAYQILFNDRFDMISGVDSETLKRVLREKIDKNISLENAYLENAHLEGADLREANLQNADLDSVHLEGADLRGSNLQYAYLSCARFEDSDLRGAKLQSANLGGAHLQRARLSENVFVPNYEERDRSELLKAWAYEDQEHQEAYQILFNDRFDMISGVDSETLKKVLREKIDKNISLQKANLGGAELQGSHLRGSNLQNAYLSCARLEDSDLRGSNLQNADLYEAELQGSDLRKANLQNAYLNYAHLERVDLRGAQLQNADLYEAELQGSDLRKANLQNAYLNYAHLEKADFRGAKLRNAVLNGAHLQGADLQSTDLFCVHLQEADLREAQLQNADLLCAELQGSDLKGIDLRGTKLYGARLSDQFYLPRKFTDQDLIEIYRRCTDQEARKQLRNILVGKELTVPE